MFGMFGSNKIKTLIFVETTYALRQFTSIDLTKLTINEQGELSAKAYDLLQIYERKRNYTKVELTIAGWYYALMSSSENSHTLSGQRTELLKGIADYLLSDSVICSYDHRDPRYFPPFFTAHAIRDLDEIPDALSKLGRPIQQVNEKFSIK